VRVACRESCAVCRVDVCRVCLCCGYRHCEIAQHHGRGD
jgi:hypothetical protein